MLKGRHKDGLESQRTILRVSYHREDFDHHLESLGALAQDNERIYASAGARDVDKAMRLFKERQLAADYDPRPADFYENLETRWSSCLMAPASQAEKFWLFDCDGGSDAVNVNAELKEHYDRPFEPYRYASKSGTHIVVQPFDRSKLTDKSRSLIHENAILLWAF